MDRKVTQKFPNKCTCKTKECVCRFCGKNVCEGGHCWEYVYEQAWYNDRHGIKKDAVYVHALVRFVGDGFKREFSHGWMEYKNKAYDWQGTEGGHYAAILKRILGSSMTKGIPLPVFYSMYHPVRIFRYTAKEILRFSKEYGHCGFWEEAI